VFRVRPKNLLFCVKKIYIDSGGGMSKFSGETSSTAKIRGVQGGGDVQVPI